MKHSKNQKINKVFVSYSRKDKEHMNVVRNLIAGLHGQSDIFIDFYSIRGGEKWENRILDYISECDLFVVVWSSNASESPWVEKEVILAKSLFESKNKPKILPVLIDDAKLNFGLDCFQSVTLNTEKNKTKEIHFIIYTLPLLFSLIQIAAYIFSLKSVISLVIIISLWVFILSFSALREINAPWNKEVQDKDKIVFFNTIKANYKQIIFGLIIGLSNIILGMILLLS